ncbi:MAG: prolyl oligopeptidase family serine peptidase [Bacteroidales bacterium]
MLRNLFFGTVCCFAITQLNAQQQTGNIVEYFGKEKIEKVDEGVVVHYFTQGYQLPTTASNGYVFQMGDALAWEIFTNNFKNPYSGNMEAVNYGRTRQAIQWEAIKTDSLGTFQGENLRKAYIYSEYNATAQEIMLLQATGGTRTILNGMPHEGDHYDYAYTLIPFKTQKGANSVLFTPGRFGRLTAKVIKPKKPVMFTKRDMTLTDIINGEQDEKWSAIRVINATESPVKDLSIRCQLEGGEQATFATTAVMDMSVRKLPFLVPAAKQTKTGKTKAILSLLDKKGKTLDTVHIAFEQRSGNVIHERTFRSRIDSSVQYFSITPSTDQANSQALVLSVHGASVEARNQARAYTQKDWVNIVSATNRRPFGYNWEEWGRIDAFEVLEQGKKLYNPSPEKLYLKGHSMGGHGSWSIGANFPDKFAAIGPCAGYPDVANYRSPGADQLQEQNPMYNMIKRGANAGRTLELTRNYLQSGVYVHHGDDDAVVPVQQSRDMRRRLAEFHPDFGYHEEAGGSHWYSNESLDFAPIFDYFKWHTIPATKSIKNLEFTTATPAVSASNYWATVEQQEKAYDFSNIQFNTQGADSLIGNTKNVATLSIDFAQTPISGKLTLIIDSTTIALEAKERTTFRKKNGVWSVGKISLNEKNPIRSGGFKQAFDNHVIFVYSTAGTPEENAWYKNKARFDAENFLYRGNSSVDVISDRELLAQKHLDRNIILYGNVNTNRAWREVLPASAPIVQKGKIIFGKKVLEGDDLGTYFIYPRKGSSKASVGVVAGTGIKGAKASYPNDYLTGYSAYPDLMIFSVDVLKDGIFKVKTAGFFGNDWSVENGDFLHQ